MLLKIYDKCFRASQQSCSLLDFCTLERANFQATMESLSEKLISIFVGEAI